MKLANVLDKEGELTEVGKLPLLLLLGDLKLAFEFAEAEGGGNDPYDNFLGEAPDGDIAAKPSNVEGAREIDMLEVRECLLLLRLLA